jgi:phage tail sheath protein FI
VLNGTDANGTDAGDNIAFEDGTDGDNLAMETGSGSYSALDTPTKSELGGGTDDYAVTAGELETGYGAFEDTESVDVNLILGGRGGGAGDSSSSQDTHVTMLTTLVEKRRDCVAFVSAYRSATVGISDSITQTDNVVEAFDLCPSSSYVVFDSSYKYQYDKYNDVFRFVPSNGDVAGLCAFTDQVADAFFSPAGFNRGNLRNAIKLSYNPKKSERDRLYRARINPITNFPGQGVCLFGDKTALSKPSAFDRINVRRLFLLLEKAIATASKFQLFEFNDEFTRAQFRNLVEPFLRDIQGRRGITDFKVKCDDSNNTGEVIDKNEFIADIFIKPARSINFITLNFIATRTGVAFSEVGG